MSLFSKFDAEAKTLASKFESVFTKLWAAEPAIEQGVAGTIGVVAPLVVAIGAAVGGEPEAALLSGIVSVIKTDLATVQTIYTQSGSSATVKGLLSSIVSNLSQLLAAGGIKNPNVLETVTKDVDSITAALQVVLAAL